MTAPYYNMILNLIRFKDDLQFIEGKKYHQLVSVLKEYEIPFNDDDDFHVPDNKELAEKLKIPYPKANSLIKELYVKILEYYSDNTLVINECEQIIHIHIPLDEEKKEIKKKDPDHYFKFSRWLKVKLPVLPRIGDEIILDFIDWNYTIINRGYVHNIEHHIIGKKQEIRIEVHPINNYYFQWKKMQEKYENRQLEERSREIEELNKMFNSSRK